MSAVAAITGAAVCGIAATALTHVVRRRLTEPRRVVVVPVLAALGVLFGALAGWRLVAWPEALAFGVAALVSALLVACDLDSHEIPHAVMWPGTGALVVSLALAAGLEGLWGRLLVALLTGVVVMVVYFAVAWFGKGQFGIADVSMSLFFGIFTGWLGPAHAIVFALGAFLVHVPVSLVALLLRRAGRTTELPFGPSLVAAAWLSAFLAPLLWALVVR